MFKEKADIVRIDWIINSLKDQRCKVKVGQFDKVDFKVGLALDEKLEWEAMCKEAKDTLAARPTPETLASDALKDFILHSNAFKRRTDNLYTGWKEIRSPYFDTSNGRVRKRWTVKNIVKEDFRGQVREIWKQRRALPQSDLDLVEIVRGPYLRFKSTKQYQDEFHPIDLAQLYAKPVAFLEQQIADWYYTKKRLLEDLGSLGALG